MKLFVLPVLFLFVAALNGGDDNFQTIRHKISTTGVGPIVVHKFEDQNNTCYVVEAHVYSGNAVSIACVKVGK